MKGYRPYLWMAAAVLVVGMVFVFWWQIDQPRAVAKFKTPNGWELKIK